ncbi:outer membrane protein Tom13 [Lindgomyces ingoldianus]|uniref:Outer membrane protein Tom13 n=1 Tax=Lindgomyces ingoldianus TaxID=673940 RepID=A0ACB6QMI9_9PLEO|nr:outer membrane protein Tom13 [Lindgomyces ingoldianus]KAF2467798.1 outer membrane protein Tom13 [Lindgomyces ingoldianus]
MAANPSPQPPHSTNTLTESGITIPSDSENYDGNHELSSSPPSSSSSPLILYSPPTFWGLVRGAAINLLLPFVNGLMLGFGELIANEVAWRFGWSGTKIFPTHRSSTRRVGPGVEMRPDPIERRRRNGREMDMYTSLE